MIRAPRYRPTLVDPYRDHLRKRRADDPAVPVTTLLAEIRELGYEGGMNLLYRYITQGRVEADGPHLSPRRVTRLLLTRPGNLSEPQLALLEKLTAACPEMASLAGLVRSFAVLLKPAPGNEAGLDDWIGTARASDLPSLHAFTRGLDLDHGAAVTLPWHNGRTPCRNAWISGAAVSGGIAGSPWSRAVFAAWMSPRRASRIWTGQCSPG